MKAAQDKVDTAEKEKEKKNAALAVKAVEDAKKIAEKAKAAAAEPEKATPAAKCSMAAGFMGQPVI